MKFAKWVKYYGGPTKLAEKLDYKLSTVTAWLKGYNTPDVFDTQAMVRLSRGMLTYDALIKEYKKMRRKPYRPKKSNRDSSKNEQAQQIEATPNETVVDHAE